MLLLNFAMVWVFKAPMWRTEHTGILGILWCIHHTHCDVRVVTEAVTCYGLTVTCYGLTVTVGICLFSGLDCWNGCGHLNFTLFSVTLSLHTHMSFNSRILNERMMLLHCTFFVQAVHRYGLCHSACNTAVKVAMYKFTCVQDLS
jgi:hypothetical protein